nr:hypothetical protein EP46_17230 [Pantoea sp. 3.5.1]
MRSPKGVVLRLTGWLRTKGVVLRLMRWLRAKGVVLRLVRWLRTKGVVLRLVRRLRAHTPFAKTQKTPSLACSARAITHLIPEVRP